MQGGVSRDRVLKLGFVLISVCVVVDVLLSAVLIDGIIGDPILRHLLDGVTTLCPFRLIMASQVFPHGLFEFLGGAHTALRRGKAFRKLPIFEVFAIKLRRRVLLLAIVAHYPVLRLCLVIDILRGQGLVFAQLRFHVQPAGPLHDVLAAGGLLAAFTSVGGDGDLAAVGGHIVRLILLILNSHR